MRHNFFVHYMHIVLLLSAVIMTRHDQAAAIPAFARKYKTSCTTCHVAVPKRNGLGEAFRRNGYVMPRGNARLIKEKPVSLGAKAWKEAWPETIWPGDIPASFPIAAYVHMRFMYDVPASKKGNQVEFDMPHEFELLIGGAFGKDVGFFGEWVAFEKGINAPGLKRFFFQFNDIFGKKDLLNIRVGRFEPGITDGYTETQRLTMKHPITLDYKAAGYWRSRDAQAGIELNGIIRHHIQYSIGVVNGEGKTVSDPTDQKDVYARLAYKLGGTGLDGNGLDADLQQTNNWMDNSFTFGIYTYFGSKQKTAINNTQYNNSFSRLGFDARLQFGNFDLLSGLILGKDENPRGDNQRLTSIAYFVEGDYLIYPWLIGVLRFERVSSYWGENDLDKYINITPNLTILFRANIRFSIEGLINIQSDKTLGGQTFSANKDEAFKWIKLNAMFVF